ncbi:MAG: GTP 3',8-cyclase MoaA [Bacteriovoracia bacterium]
MLIDHFGRRIRKLRLSLTDKCNLRCHYCMPVDQVFMDESHYLLTDEIVNIVKELQELGLEEVRLTGGEPLMRKSFPEIVEKLSALGLKKIGLTTNGIYLDKYLDLLKRHKIFHLNISLDSLDEDNFRKITFGNQLRRILANIRMAVSQGFVIKINTVMMRGVNDHEVLDFVKFSEEEKVEVRFLELMRIGHARPEQQDQFISARELSRKIRLRHHLKTVVMPLDSTSYNFVTERGAQVGFIASESEPFCGQCSRWRLSADGILRACLLKDEGLSLRTENRIEVYQKLLGMKPVFRPVEVSHSMNTIGG